jgi:hypothetical protein
METKQSNKRTYRYKQIQQHDKCNTFTDRKPSKRKWKNNYRVYSNSQTHTRASLKYRVNGNQQDPLRQTKEKIKKRTWKIHILSKVLSLPICPFVISILIGLLFSHGCIVACFAWTGCSCSCSYRGGNESVYWRPFYWSIGR